MSEEVAAGAVRAFPVEEVKLGVDRGKGSRVLVTIGPVEVPHGAEHPLRLRVEDVGTPHIDALRVAQFEIAREVEHIVEGRERRHVDHLGSALGKHSAGELLHLAVERLFIARRRFFAVSFDIVVELGGFEIDGQLVGAVALGVAVVSVPLEERGPRVGRCAWRWRCSTAHR